MASRSYIRTTGQPLTTLRQDSHRPAGFNYSRIDQTQREQTSMNAAAAIDFTVLKSRQQTAWASGDYAIIGTTLQLVGELLAESCDLRFDERVLDVAAGNGNATLAAARRGCRVV